METRKLEKVLNRKEPTAAEYPGLIPTAKVRQIRAAPLDAERYPLYVWADTLTGTANYLAEPITRFPFLTHLCDDHSGCPGCAEGAVSATGKHELSVALDRGEDIYVSSSMLGKFSETGELEDLPDGLCDLIDDIVYYEIIRPETRSKWLSSPPVHMHAP